MAVELIANIDKCLHRGYIDIVDGREIENDGFENRAVVVWADGCTTARAWIIPWSVL